MVSDLDIYLFDLRGYLLMEGALTADEVRALNDCLDEIPALAPGEWYGYVHGHAYGDATIGNQLSAVLRGGQAL